MSRHLFLLPLRDSQGNERLAAASGSCKNDGKLEGNAIKNASFRNGKLSFDVELEGRSHHVAAELPDRKLSGAWKGEQDGGPIACEPETADWEESAAIVPLYAYRRSKSFTGTATTS